MRFIGVIPARYASSRFPGKAIIKIAGKTLIQWVYERVCQACCLDDVVVATDDERILQVVEVFGGKVMMTRSGHISGTDRVAEVAESLPGDIFVNIQGDEPLIAPDTIEAVCAPFEDNPEIQVTTARVKITDSREVESPHAVKVVVNGRGQALYFSRSRIPYPRRPTSFYKHLGIYAYRRDFLLALSELKPSPLENIEGLEQLRFLENGISVRVVEVREDSWGVDTIEDVDRVRPLLENMAKSTEDI